MSPGKNLTEMNLFQGNALPVTKLHVGLDTCSFEILWPARQMTQEMNGSASGCHPAGSGLTYPHIHSDCYPKVRLGRNITFRWCYTSAWNKHQGFRLELKLTEVNEKECHRALQALDQTLHLLKHCSDVPATAGCCRFSLMQNYVLHPCQERSGEDRAEGHQEPGWHPSHLFCARVW